MAWTDDEEGKKEADDDRSHDVEQEVADVPGMGLTLHDCLDAGCAKRAVRSCRADGVPDILVK